MSAVAPEHAVAVIGMAGRFPGAADINQFWNNIRLGVESISKLSRDQMRASGVAQAVLSDPHLVPKRGVLEGIEQFDASFFGYSHREAAVMDPQQRMFLECAWHAIEHAGYDPKGCHGAVGVYAGSGMNRYLLHHLRTLPEVVNKLGELELIIGGEKDFLATRIAYKLNLRGPAITIQTACSTSLAAIVMAYQSLLTHGCDMALAGGISAHVPSHCGYIYQQGGTLSPDGACRAFDADARGMVPGDGLGIVVLKRLDDAIKDNDTVYAVIRGGATNNDGSGKIGYTAPSADGQAAAITLALALADVTPQTIGYVEAHGTGTELGDPIEIGGLTQAFGTGLPQGSIAIGSVKTNTGHLDAAAGVAGFIKAVLALHHKELPPSLHFCKPNPKLELDNTPFYVNTELKPWHTNDGTPRRAGVSSFGIGGTNAHVVLEEAPLRVVTPSISNSATLLVLSAQSETARAVACEQLATYLENNHQANLDEIAYTLQTGRHRFPYRHVIVCSSCADAVSQLRSFAAPLATRQTGDDITPEVVFLFPGQGSQHARMAEGLRAVEPVFAREIDRCCEILLPLLKLDLRKLLWPDATADSNAFERLDQTEFAQPALFVVEYALATLWMSWGVKPAAMLGHSVGEYVAACLAGVLSLEDALRIVVIRGRLMQSMPTGKMLAVQLPNEKLAAMIGQELSVAVINDSESCVVAGPESAIDALAAQLSARSVASRKLRTSHAFHSSMMDEALGPFESAFDGVVLKRPTIPIASNVTGNWLTGEQATDPSYWALHLRQTVQFNSCLKTITSMPKPRILLEIGPGNTLTTLAAPHCASSAGTKLVATCRHPKQAVSDQHSLCTAVGRLWTEGISFHWNAFHSNANRRRVALPGYPFNRQRHWLADLAGNPEQIGSAPASSPQTSVADVANYFSLPSWSQQDFAFEAASICSSPKRWLILANEHVRSISLCGVLKNRLRTLNQTVDDLILSSVDGASVSRELGEVLAKSSRRPELIIDLCDYLIEGSIPNDRATASTIRVQRIAQAIARNRADHSMVRWLGITNALYSISGEPNSSPGRAAAIAAARVAALELSSWSCCSLDLGPSFSIDSIIGEALISSEGQVAALRGHRRFVQTIQPIKLSHDLQKSEILIDGCCFLLSGGLGGIGLALAEGIAARCRAKFVLVGRTTLPMRKQWGSISNNSPECLRQIAAIQRIEAMGSQVLTIAADVTDISAMRTAVRTTIAKFGRLDGVIHSAGIAPGGSLIFRSDADIARVINVKVGGAMALEASLAELNLKPRLGVYCSSLAALIGVPGQIDYSAANAVLDAMSLCNETRSNYQKLISINWDTWSEVGMAAKAGEKGGLGAATSESLALGLKSACAVEAFLRVLETDWPQVIISPNSVTARIRAGAAAFGTASLANSHREARDPSVSKNHFTSSNVEDGVVKVWKEFLGVAQAGPKDDFFELGGHSLLAVQMVHRLQEMFGVDLEPDAIFQAATVERLVQLLKDTLSAKSREISAVAKPSAAPQTPTDRADTATTAERLLGMVESLSDEQVQMLLEQELSGIKEIS